MIYLDLGIQGIEQEVIAKDHEGQAKEKEPPCIRVLCLQ
jgi:hypothetical protein